MPSARWRLAAVAAGGGVLAIRGRGNPLALERYDPARDRWTRLEPLKAPKPNPFAAAVGERVFVAGGVVDGKEDYALWEEYEPATGRWTRRAPLPTPRTDMALASCGGAIYAMGGWTPHGLTDRVERYDPAADRWTAYASLPRPRCFAAAAVAGDRIYLMGGAVYWRMDHSRRCTT